MYNLSFLVFDTETTGLPDNFNVAASPITMENWDRCRMVQIAWRIYSAEKELTTSSCHIIKLEGFAIPDASTVIHKITTEMALAKGLPISDVLGNLFDDIKAYGVETTVAHNIKFDNNVVMSEIYRTGDDHLVSIWTSLKRHCTMLSNKSLFGGRWPKLSVL
ncbi:hypothetical protein PC128_g26067 [Phytophthora cactorum]|nr:hypothetical protein PC120_g25419 [Phytophthora cactorum]KAG3041468.1 hypothetical protein PC121_g23355 [Phytophthora cactorum]KAG3135392.1 hypothetical protein PC128_g26067 [Phytophthora cactorum]KAG4038612.1 hypothetical protein PC123_g25826 [Phytophthora cactorum]